MPAPINISVQSASKSAMDSSHSRSHSKKTRIIRRRGRGRDGVDSDDEIEREVGSESESDDQSSLGSDSESESGSDEGHGGIVTPSTTQSPPPLDIGGPSSSLKPAELVNGSAGPFVSTTDWAQIVADENANGGAELPVIDFADMHTHVISEPVPAPAHKAPSPRPRKQKPQKQAKKASAARTTEEPLPAAEPQAEEPAAAPAPTTTEEPSTPSTSKPTHQREPSDAPRPRGQTARQAYQQRLQTDPAFVPRVGEFWGHDDRLLDKDLRSLSGWWRGKWQGTRGGGRGGRGGFGMRGGRGGHVVAANGAPSHADQDEEGSAAGPAETAQAVDRAWGHDGFEEMKRKEEARREERRHQEQQQQHGPQRGGFRGRGGFVGGRGRGFSRGGGVAPAGHAPSAAATAPSSAQDPSTHRVWFAMKPEKVWTKHTDTFLYLEPVLRPRAGQAPGIRVKLPGRDGQVVRSRSHSQATASSSQGPTVHTSTSVANDELPRQFIVRIPKRAQEQKEPAPEPELATTATEVPLEDTYAARPHAVPEHVPSTTTAAAPTEQPARPVSPEQPAALSPVAPTAAEVSPSLPMPQPDLEAQPPMFIPDGEVVAPVPISIDQSRPQPPVLPPLQTTFSPVPQSSPQYGSPYMYQPALPPGIAVNPQGYAYDVATGQPVYIQTPPPAMYTPRPMMHGYMPPPPFVPGHMHHPSQEFVPQGPTPPINGFIDPATGVPIFAPPRQNSRIEIRAPPAGGYEGKSGKRPSGLRNGVSSSEEVPVSVSAQDPSEGSGNGSEGVGAPPGLPMPQMDPAMMMYAPYQQQYYYAADPNAYAQGPYMDMGQGMMPAPYEMYPAPGPDQRGQQPMVYY